MKKYLVPFPLLRRTEKVASRKVMQDYLMQTKNQGDNTVSYKQYKFLKRTMLTSTADQGAFLKLAKEMDVHVDFSPISLTVLGLGTFVVGLIFVIIPFLLTLPNIAITLGVFIIGSLLIARKWGAQIARQRRLLKED